MIDGIEFKALSTHTDERGFFRELLRRSDPIFAGGFGQLSHSRMYGGVIKAWHYHHIQTDWWYVCSGVLKVGLHDLRKDSPSFGRTMHFLMGDHQAAQIVKIPPGIAHGCKAVQGPVDLFYVTSHEYNPDDEIRIAHDDPRIGFDWISGPAIT